MRIRQIFLGLWGIFGWVIVSMIFWVLFINGGKITFDATLWNEFYLEFIIVNVSLILVIIFFIFELKEIFNEKRKKN